MNETEIDRELTIVPVTPEQIANARAFIGHQADAADLLEAIGIGADLRILTTDDITTHKDIA